MDPPQRSGWQAARPVLLTTLVPVAAAVGFFALATYAHKSPSIKDQPSMAAFDACLTEHNLQSSGSYPTQFDRTIAAQQQMQACGDKIPQKVLQQAADQQRSAMSSYRECIHNMAGGTGGGGFGRFRSGPSQSFRDAFAICRSLLQGSGGGGQQTIPKKLKNAPPIA